jgi:16S rRNA (guanine527-N7)-methyltransferase
MIIDPKWSSLVDVFLEFNAKLNLSAIRDPEGVYQKHVLDSIELLHIDEIVKELADDSKTMYVADVWTWGWFPLLPLAMSFPHIHFMGIDSVRKKLQAIQNMCIQLGIKNCEFLWTRIEECKIHYDIITARAVAHVEKLLPRLEKMLKPWSKLILYKQLKGADEEWNGEKTERDCMLELLPKYNLILKYEHLYTLFEGDIQRVIYVLEKWI